MADDEVSTLNRIRVDGRGAEESGLTGSILYVSTLEDNQLEQIAANLDFDTFGSPDFLRFVDDSSAGP